MQAGVTHAHHQSILRRLRDERQVINSRQFPFRFFAAYQVGKSCLLELQNKKHNLSVTKLVTLIGFMIVHKMNTNKVGTIIGKIALKTLNKSIRVHTHRGRTQNLYQTL